MLKKVIGGGVSTLGKGAQGFSQEFMDFLQKYQVIGLAVAVVIGTAATKLVNSTVADIIMPIITWLSYRAATGGQRNWSSGP